MEEVHRLFQCPLASSWIAEKQNARKIAVSGLRDSAVAIDAAGRLLVSLFQPGRISRSPTGTVPDWATILKAHGTHGKHE